MTGEAWPIDASAGAPSYTAAEGRQLFSAYLQNTTADGFGVRAGRRPGAGMVATCPTSTTYQVTPGAYIAYPRFSATQGPYLCQFGANETGSVTAAHASLPRKDILYVSVDDASAGDGSGNRRAQVLYLAGTPNASPVAPAVPARGNLLATITVPQSGGGSPSVVMGPMGVAAGGVLPVADPTDRTSLTGYAGLRVYEISTGREWTHNGSGWVIQSLGDGKAVASGSSVTTTSSVGGLAFSFGITFAAAPIVVCNSGDFNVFEGSFADNATSTTGYNGVAISAGGVRPNSVTLRVNWHAHGTF